MARRIPATRFDDLVAAATEVFIERGYRLTQMADVASAMGVAKGTLYTYVESKEALFALCLAWADHKGSIDLPDSLPLPTPMPGDLAAVLAKRLASGAAFPVLRAALANEHATDPRAELEAVLTEQYVALERNRCGIKLIERASDHKEIGPLWQKSGREEMRQDLAQYIELRARSGEFRPVANARLTARFAIEVIATWAMHIHWDRSPENHDRVEARTHAIDFLTRGLVA